MRPPWSGRPLATTLFSKSKNTRLWATAGVMRTYIVPVSRNLRDGGD